MISSDIGGAFTVSRIESESSSKIGSVRPKMSKVLPRSASSAL